MNDYTLRLVRLLRAPRRKVFDAWREPTLVQKWLAPEAMTAARVEIDFRVGGRYEIHMEGDHVCITRGEYREIVADERLVFTWCNSAFDFHETLVTVTLADRDDGTELQLEHRYFLSEDETSQHENGWHGCMDKLELLVAVL